MGQQKFHEGGHGICYECDRPRSVVYPVDNDGRRLEVSERWTGYNHGELCRRCIKESQRGTPRLPERELPKLKQFHYPNTGCEGLASIIQHPKCVECSQSLCSCEYAFGHDCEAGYEK